MGRTSEGALFITFEMPGLGRIPTFYLFYLILPPFYFHQPTLHILGDIPECSLSWLPVTDIIKYTKSFYQMIKEATVSKNFIYLACCINR